MKLHFLGGVRTVTGTCFYLEFPEQKVLIDCGMYQGEKSDFVNRETFRFNPPEIECVFLTHAHIDHSGLVPKLVKEGFRGKIITTPATADLLEIMLYDSAQIQESDAAWQARKAARAGRDAIPPLYTIDDVRSTMPFFNRVPYGKIMRAGNGLKYRFLDAGHILGSGSLEIWFQDSHREKKIVFSGDIGKKNNPILNDPEPSTHADYIVIESTYGNRQHKSLDDTVNELVSVIKTTFSRGGNVIIPSFAIGRTQDLLYMLNRLVREGRLYKINVYIDSPLAEEATKTYLAHPECFDEEAKRILNSKAEREAILLRFTSSVDESRALNRIRSGAIIIAGGGMCEGGRIRHHLKHNLWRPECSVVFVGFQANGTLGRRIVNGARIVRIFGEDIAVRASIHTIGGFSAHADQKELLEWLSAFKNSPEVFIVHGEEETALKFSDIVREKLGLVTRVPSRGEEFEL